MHKAPILMEKTGFNIPISQELRKLALRVGKIFGLDICGLDVVETLQGPVVVDINDFPSFGQVPHAVSLVSAYVLQLASRAELQRSIVPMKRMQGILSHPNNRGVTRRSRWISILSRLHARQQFV
jgi:hypothetical protein